MAMGDNIRSEFLLEDGVAFLNHGSYGATPRAVLVAQDEWRTRMERQPVRFMGRELPAALRRAAGDLAGILGARSDDLVFVENATAGVNAVVRSVALGPGDDVLTTDHAYPAVRNALSFRCRDAGATLVEAQVPFPLSHDDQVVAAVEAALGSKTRLAVFDHVTSQTAVIFPVARLIERCRARNVPVLIDGAHAPGMIALDVAALGADWYVGNAHKWLFSAKGCGFLWARPEHQGNLHPLVISHGLDDGFIAEFDWVGTRDASAWLAVSDAIAFHRRMGGQAVMTHNRELAGRAADMLVAAWSTEIGAPPSMRGAMATVRIPGDGGNFDDAMSLHDRLHDDYGIEVPISSWDGALWVRISAQIYNTVADYQRLADAVGGGKP
jgi:isopenicillin-N epimerase